MKLTKAELAMLEPDYIEPRMVAKYELIAQVILLLLISAGRKGIIWSRVESY